MRTVARLARSRADRGSSATHGDGLERLGAARALRQLAVDLEVSADACEANPRPSRGRGRPTLPRPAPAHVPYGSPSLPGRAEIRRSRSSVGAARSAAEIERSEEHTSELQSLMRISYAVFCLKKKNTKKQTNSDCK